MWEYILGDDILADEPYEDDPNQRRKFRLRFWEGDEDELTSDEEDYFDEQESVSGFGFKLGNWGGSDDESDTDTESLSSMEGTEASSISQDDINTEEVEEIKGPTTLLTHRLLTKPKKDAGAKDHKQEDSSIASDAHSSKERSQRKMASLRSLGFIPVMRKQNTKKNLPLLN